MRTPPLYYNCRHAPRFWTRRTLYGNYGGANHHKHNPHKLHDLPVLKRVADRVLETAKKTVVGGVGWSCTILDMADMACSMHLSQRALLRMPRRCTQRDLRTVRQRIMPYFPQTTIVKSTTGRNRAAAHVQSIVQNAISMARVIGKPPPSGVAIVVISVDATSLWKASSTRADVWVNVWGGAKYASKVKLWASWFCMDGGDEQAFLRSLDISANLNQEVRGETSDIDDFV